MIPCQKCGPKSCLGLKQRGKTLRSNNSLNRVYVCRDCKTQWTWIFDIISGTEAVKPVLRGISSITP